MHPPATWALRILHANCCYHEHSISIVFERPGLFHSFCLCRFNVAAHFDLSRIIKVTNWQSSWLDHDHLNWTLATPWKPLTTSFVLSLSPALELSDRRLGQFTANSVVLLRLNLFRRSVYWPFQHSLLLSYTLFHSFIFSSTCCCVPNTDDVDSGQASSAAAASSDR